MPGDVHAHMVKYGINIKWIKFVSLLLSLEYDLVFTVGIILFWKHFINNYFYILNNFCNLLLCLYSFIEYIFKIFNSTDWKIWNILFSTITVDFNVGAQKCELLFFREADKPSECLSVGKQKNSW